MPQSKYDLNKHHRHSIRIKAFDYSQPGLYFITICTHQKENIFGNIVNGKMQLNEFGKIVENVWINLPNHYANLILDAFCIMPNHVHAVIVLNNSDDGVDVGTSNKVGASPDGNIPQSKPAHRTITKKHPLSEIVRAFKSFSTRQINELRDSEGNPVWQRNYYEHIIRDEEDYNRIYEYIENNPMKWLEDEDYSM